MTLFYYKTELSGTEIENVYLSEEAALEAAKKEWEAAGEEYDEDLTWITPVTVSKDIPNLEEILEQYKQDAFDPTQPFFLAVYHLAKNNANDFEFGSKIRKLIQKFEKVNKERISLEINEQLKNILKKNGQA
jgi:hypothetical protein